MPPIDTKIVLLAISATLNAAFILKLGFNFFFVRIGDSNETNLDITGGDKMYGLLNFKILKDTTAAKGVKKKLERNRKIIEDLGIGKISRWFNKHSNVLDPDGKINSGFPGLDELLGNDLDSSQLITLLGPASSGKTTLLLDVTRQNAIRNKRPVMYFSMGTKSSTLIDRLISAEAFVDAIKIKRNDINEEDELARVRESLNALSNAPIFIDDLLHLSSEMAVQRIRDFYKIAGKCVVLIDGLDLMGGSKTITSNLQGLRKLSIELNLPIIVSITSSGKLSFRHRVHVEDIPDAIGRISDIVLMIQEGEDELPIRQVSVLKNREGRCGYVELYHDTKRVSFQSIERA